MTASYDPANIFAKIVKGEIPNDTVLETEHTLAFRDIAPQAPFHVLVIPKGQYVTAGDFMAKATAEEQADYWAAVARIIAGEGLEDGGYRLISNAGRNGVQEVPHFHLHILAGRPLGRMLSPV